MLLTAGDQRFFNKPHICSSQLDGCSSLASWYFYGVDIYQCRNGADRVVRPSVHACTSLGSRLSLQSHYWILVVFIFSWPSPRYWLKWYYVIVLWQTSASSVVTYLFTNCYFVKYSLSNAISNISPPPLLFFNKRIISFLSGSFWLEPLCRQWTRNVVLSPVVWGDWWLGVMGSFNITDLCH